MHWTGSINFLYCKFGLSPANGIISAYPNVTSCEASYVEECLFIGTDENILILREFLFDKVDMKFEGASVMVVVIWEKGDIFWWVLKLPVSQSRGCIRHRLHEDL